MPRELHPIVFVHDNNPFVSKKSNTKPDESEDSELQKEEIEER